MTTEQVYKVARAQRKMPSYTKTRHLRYFKNVVRLPRDNIESNVTLTLLSILSRGSLTIWWQVFLWRESGA